MGIVSPAAAIHAKAVIAGVQREGLTERTAEEEWHDCAEATVTVQLQAVGIPADSWDLARMLRHDPPVRLILMTAYHRLLPAQSCEEDDLHQYVKEPAVGDQGAVSTFQKLQMWKSAARRSRQMGGILPGVSTLVVAFDKILAVDDYDGGVYAIYR